MKEEFVKLVSTVAIHVRKRDFRELGASQLVNYIPTLIQKYLAVPLQDCSPILIGNTILEIFSDIIERDMKPDETAIISPDSRNFTYLDEFIIQGKEWKIVADEYLHVSRSVFYEIQTLALESLAITLWQKEQKESAMSGKVLTNLANDPFIPNYIERFNSEGKNYIDEIIFPALRSISRPWIIGITGDPGVGKSAIVFTAASRAVHQRLKYKLPFDAVVWFSFKSPNLSTYAEKINQGTSNIAEQTKKEGKESTANKKHEQEQALLSFYDEIGKTLQYRGNHEIKTVKDKSLKVDELISKYICLFVIDNLDSDYLISEESIDSIFDFVNRLPAPHKALLTLRKNQSKRTLESITIENMSDSEAKHFLTNQAETHKQLFFDDISFNKVLHKTNGNPLAMRWALGSVRQLGYTIDEALEFKTYGKQMLDDMFGIAYFKLPENAKKILLVLPIFSDVATRETIGQASGISGAQQVEMLGRLYYAHMIERTDEKSFQEDIGYSLLPFPKEFVLREWMDSENYIGKEPISQFIEEAYDRLTNYYIDRLQSVQDRKERALIFLKNEKRNVYNVFAKCSESNDPRLVQILDLMGIYLGTLHIMDVRESWGRRAVKLLTEKKDFENANWYFIRDVAWSISRNGTIEAREQGTKLFEQALHDAKINGWEKNYALALTNLCRLKGDGKGSLEKLDEAKNIFLKFKQNFWVSVNLRTTADLLVDEDELTGAIDIYNNLLNVFQQSGDINGYIETKSALAYAIAKNNQTSEALQIIEECIKLAEKSIEPPSYSEAYALINKARILHLNGDNAEANEVIQKSIAFLLLLGMTYWADFWLKWSKDLQ